MILEKLIKEMRRAKENNEYIAIAVSLPDSDIPEVIINHPDNIENKIKYYEGAYNENCELKSFNKIKILGIETGKRFSY